MSDYLKLIYYFVKNYFNLMKLPVATSIDVTNNCNLKCSHCYYFKQNLPNELDDQTFIEHLTNFKKKYPSIIHATWVGGETLLRQNIVDQGRKKFIFNMIVTNGTLPIPNWKNCVFNVSIDGIKQYYEKLRKADYFLVKNNVLNTKSRVNIACVLNNENYLCIQEMLSEWSKQKITVCNWE